MSANTNEIRAIFVKQAEIEFERALANLRRIHREAPDFLQSLIENFDFLTATGGSSLVHILGTASSAVPFVVKVWPQDIVQAMDLVAGIIDDWRNPNGPMFKIARIRQDRVPLRDYLTLPREEREGWHKAPWIQTSLDDPRGLCFIFTQWFEDETEGSTLHGAALLTPENLQVAGAVSREAPSTLQTALMKILADLACKSPSDL